MWVVQNRGEYIETVLYRFVAEQNSKEHFFLFDNVPLRRPIRCQRYSYTLVSFCSCRKQADVVLPFTSRSVSRRFLRDELDKTARAQGFFFLLLLFFSFTFSRRAIRVLAWVLLLLSAFLSSQCCSVLTQQIDQRQEKQERGLESMAAWIHLTPRRSE